MSGARWPASIRVLHAATAILVVVLIATALASRRLVEAAPDLAETLVSLHMMAGLTVGVLTIARLSLRFVLRAPPTLRRSRFDRGLIAVGTTFFYGALVLLPLAGVGKLILSGADVAPFGLVLIRADGVELGVARALSDLHRVAGWLLFVAAAGHVVAVLAHRARGDTTILARMW